ncbi:hypothetical protein ACWGB8_12895 [Kitasatospora sp. NPDC054939]
MANLAENASLLPDPLQVWDIIRGLTGSWLGAGSMIAVVIATAITARMWYLSCRDGYRAARRGGRTITAAVRFSVRHLGRIPVHQKVFASLTTVSVVLLQALWLAATYFFVSVLAANLRSIFGGPPVGDVPDLLRWNGANSSYTTACALLLAGVYILSITRNDELNVLLGVLPGIPAAVCAVLMAVIAAIATVVSSLASLVGADAYWGDTGFFWLTALVLMLYSASGFFALGATSLSVHAWREQPTATHTAPAESLP